MTIDPREFRDTVGCFATGITVITTVDDDGDPVGLTANSFTSLSLDPPMVLFCLDYKVASFEIFNNSTHFGVNILAAEEQDISNRFAKSGPEKWEGFEYETWESKVPIFPGSLANIECRTADIFKGGDHIIVTGEALRIHAGDESRQPLLYYRGGYATISD